jgi:RimJ/RimL family protein N-acetyltransferase
VSAVIAETRRLRLREWDAAAKSEFARTTNTPAVMHWLGGVSDDATMAAAFARLDTYQRDHGFTFWAVERKSDAAILGFCGLKRVNTAGAEPLHGEMEVGWRLREDAWGQGYAKEAAIASLDLAFDRFAAPRVVALTADGNKPSQGLMLRLGMRPWPEQDFVDDRFPPDLPPNPVRVFVVDASEWPAARATALA